MKKVLALVLAVIMVCTMAMAITVNTTTADVVSEDYAAMFIGVTPGASIYWTQTELSDEDGLAVSVANAEDAAKYTVKVTLASGADKIASQGWAKDVNGNWVYALVTKADSTAVLDDKADIVIDSVVVTKTGVNVKNTIKYKNTAGEYGYMYMNGTDPTMYFKKLDKVAELGGSTTTRYFVSAFDFGRTADKLTLSENMTITAAPAVLYTMTKAQNGPAAVEVITAGETVDTNKATSFSYTLKAGEKVIFDTIGTYVDLTNSLNKDVVKEIIDKDATVQPVLSGAVVPNKAVTITVDGQKEGYLYLVGADGKLTNLNAKFNDNKVLTATALVTGPVILSDTALTAVNATTTTGTTTNPGTGANDVVGVAAALAVVALVSGAAISLKK